jgi:hypothetical protein
LDYYSVRTHFGLDYDYDAFRDLAAALGTPHLVWYIKDSGGTNVQSAYAEFASYSISIENISAAAVPVTTFTSDFPTSVGLPLAGVQIQAAS